MAPVDPVVGALLERCSFPVAGTPVWCAVSGGADSTALLALAVAAGCRATAIHVDHGLRPGSAAEAETVASTAARLGAGFRGEQVEVEPGPNLEARARAARHAVLPADTMTGHTADDRAETVLLNLMWGSGPAGLSGISRDPRRPLLDLRRADTEAVCAHLDLALVTDPSNRDPAFRRNRIRHELLPLLADIADRDPVPVLTRQADLFGGIDRVLTDLAAGLDVESAVEVASAPVPVAGAALRAWLQRAGVASGYGVDHSAVMRILDVASQRSVATEVAGGWRISRSRGRLRLEPPATRDGPGDARAGE